MLQTERITTKRVEGVRVRVSKPKPNLSFVVDITRDGKKKGGGWGRERLRDLEHIIAIIVIVSC